MNKTNKSLIVLGSIAVFAATIGIIASISNGSSLSVDH